MPGNQHQMAKTFGAASEACLAERQASGDPLKWRKFVSYAEFTPAHTPAEGHHIPGYSGHVPGVYSENLYAKTFGKVTLKAVSGKFHKGVKQDPKEQYKSSMDEHFGDNGSHPGKATDILKGGVSWTAASPYNINEGEDLELEPVHPWPPSMVQIASGKEPVQPSPLLKNFEMPGEETAEPAMRISQKPDPHDPTDPEKRTKTVTEGNYQIPGYSGFIPGVQAEGLFGQTYARVSAAADQYRERQDSGEIKLKLEHMGEDGIIPLNGPPQPRPLTSAEMDTTKVDLRGGPPFAKHVPGYTGHVPGMMAESVYGKTYGHASHMVMNGDVKRFNWRVQGPEERFKSSSKTDYPVFGHVAKIDDGHITYAHEKNNPAKANYLKNPPPTTDVHMPGYSGFVPGVQAKNIFGKTTQDASRAALAAEKQRLLEAKRTSSAPLPNDNTSVGMLQFKPDGFQYQKRMQGDWNNGMLGSRNYSAVKLEEKNIWKTNVLYKTSAKEALKGHQPWDVPKQYAKGIPPNYENMDHALRHKSVYLGFAGN